MAFGTLSSRFLGLLRDQLFAAFFPRIVTDAWTIAFRIPNLFRRLLGEGSLSVSFIPVYIKSRVDDPTGVEAQKLSSALYSLLFLILSTITILGVIFSEPIVRLIVDSAYEAQADKLLLTVQMAQIMFVFIFLMSTYAYMMALLNSVGQFGLAAFAPTLWNLTMIAANFFPKDWQRFQGEALAWGVVVGGFFQMAILIPALKKANLFPILGVKPWHPGLKRVFRNMLPGFAGIGLLQFQTVMNTYFASSLYEGAQTHVYLADRLLELPLSLIAVSLGTALLPTLARHWAAGKREVYLDTVSFYFSLSLFVALPAAVGLFFLSESIVRALFEWGRFTSQETTQVAVLVQVYAFTLIIASSSRIVIAGFNAVQNTWFPAVVSAIGLGVHLLLAPQFIEIFGLKGLVISTLLSGGVGLLLLSLGFRYWMGPFFKLKRTLLFLIPLTGLGGASWLWNYIYGYFDLSKLMEIVALLGWILLSILFYAIISHLLKLSEWLFVWNIIVARLKRKKQVL